MIKGGEDMTYVLSDLHGRYDLYMAMLKKINFGDGDTLYILGDCVDRGDEGLKIVLDIAQRDNVICLMGNHDFVASSILPNLERGFPPGRLADMRGLLDAWIYDGGTAHLSAVVVLGLPVDVGRFDSAECCGRIFDCLSTPGLPGVQYADQHPVLLEHRAHVLGGGHVSVSQDVGICVRQALFEAGVYRAIFGGGHVYAVGDLEYEKRRPVLFR